MNFKKYYVNGHKWTVYITYRNKRYNIETEHWWNNYMYRLTLFTTLRYVIEKDKDYFVIYEKYLFRKTIMDVFPTENEAIENLKIIKRKKQ